MKEWLIIKESDRSMKRKRVFQPVIIALVLLVSLFVTACQTADTTNTPASNAPKEILIGASIPKSGSLSGFGLYAEWGYSTAIREVNQAGGLYLSQYHTKVPVRLITYDDQTVGAKAAANIEHLVKVDKVNALLGTATPPLTIPASITADNLHMPIVSGMTPIRAFLSGK